MANKKHRKPYIMETRVEDTKKEESEIVKLDEALESILPFLLELNLSETKLVNLSKALKKHGYEDPARTKAMLGKHMGPTLMRIYSAHSGGEGSPNDLVEAYHNASKIN